MKTTFYPGCFRGRRAIGVLATMALLLAGTVAPARATIWWTGMCVLELEFEFDPPLGSVTGLGHPEYSITVRQPKDLDESSEGTQACVVSLDLPNEQFYSTSAGGSGWSVSWTCGTTQGTGSWNQAWDPDLPMVSGFHLITGTWGHWNMVVWNNVFTFAGVLELTVHPEDAAKISECEKEGLDSIRMLGTQIFQDPQTPND